MDGDRDRDGDRGEDTRVDISRREVIAGALGLTVLGAGAAYAARPTASEDGDGSVAPVEIETLDAPGSEAGTVEVPRRGDVSVVEFFATWCGVCAGMMDDLNEVNDEIGDDVQFISVTNEPVGHTVTRDEVVDWWRDHGGNWTVGMDDDLMLTDALDGTSVPTTVVLDEENRVVYSGTGEKTADEILEQVEQVL